MKAIHLVAAAAIGLAMVATPERSQAAQTEVSPEQHSELSARKRKRQQVYVRRNLYVTDSRSPYYLRPGVRPSFGYIGPPGYAGEYAWRKSIGQCVEDLGYGRWSPCGTR